MKKIVMKMNRGALRLFAVWSLAVLASLAAAPSALASDESEARGAMERAFELLRSGEYGALYGVLPTASQRRVSRERFVGALNRVRGMYELERLEITSVRVAGDLAVVDTVVYGRALRPVAGEGKIVARQYMVREAGRWRVTTNERSTVRPLLAANPDFARKFPPREPRIFIKRDGNWVDISALRNSLQRRRTK
jgi:hypothetical protein